MEQQEYKERLVKIQQEAERQKRNLAVEYALSNSPYDIGDVVKDHLGYLKIEKVDVTVTFGSQIPECVYYGVELKKDLTPMKSQTGRGVYQSNLLNNQSK